MGDRSAPLLSVSIRPKGKKAEPINVSERVTSLTFEDGEKKADKATLTVDNFDLAAYDADVFRQGNVLEFTWGYDGRFAPARSAVIKSIKGGAQISVEAFSKSVLMHRETKCRIFEGRKRSEVVELIARENGFATEDVLHVQDTEVVHEFITQARMTDAQFLRHLANKEGFEFFVDFDGLHFHERRFDQKPIRKFVYYIDQGQGDIIGTPTIEETLHANKGRVKLAGRDPKSKTTFEVTADQSTERDKVEATEFVSIPGKGLVEVTATAPGPPEQNVANEETLPTSQTTAEGAEREAAGRYKRSRANSVKLTFQAIGDPNVVAKSMIEVTGIGEAYSGLYYVETIKHSISASGYVMDLQCKRSGRQRLGGTRSVSPANTNHAPSSTSDASAPGQLEPVLVSVPGQGLVTQYVKKSGRERGKQ